MTEAKSPIHVNEKGQEIIFFFRPNGAPHSAMCLCCGQALWVDVRGRVNGVWQVKPVRHECGVV